MCMCGCELFRNCMIDGNFKLYIWNWYLRRYAMINGNDVCMMYDKINMHILIMFTTTWKWHTSKLELCKMLKHVYECMRSSKICNSTARIRSSVTYGLCVMKYAHIICDAWYVLELKNYIINMHFYSKAKIQPSLQIKLWGGYGLRENRRKSHTKLWKFSYSLLILW